MFSFDSRKSKVWMGILTALGLLLVILGLVMLFIFPGMLTKKIKQNLILVDGTPTYEKWVQSPVPIYLSLYFFHVKNPDKILTGEKPVLEEIGPFVYTEMRKKDVTGWDMDKGTVHYINEKHYYFQPDLSVANESTLITIPNIPLLTISKLIREKLSFFTSMTAYALVNGYKNDTLFITKPVRELLFDGFRVDIVADALQTLSSLFSTPPSLKTRFGFLYQKNGTREEFYSVYTGEKGTEDYTEIDTFLNQSSLTHWHTPYCNMLNGTDGKQFPFPLDRERNVYVFSPELCRSLYLEYEQDLEVEGIGAYRYLGTGKLFARTPENQGFCTDPKDCPRGGIHQVSRCKKGAPIVISAPHFYEADPYYVSTVEGLRPEKEHHETRLDIEPQTGVTLQARRRIQISVEMEPNKVIINLKSAPKMVFPVMWTEQAATIPPDLAQKFINKVKRPALIANVIFIAAIVIGALCLLLVFLLTLTHWLKPSTASAKKDPLPVSYTPVATRPPEQLLSAKA